MPDREPANASPDGRSPFFGVFAALARRHDPDLDLSGAYAGLLAELSVGGEVQDGPDIAFFLGQAGRFGGPVLELGCGAGRVALPLARAGHQVVAVDRSAPMLAELEARLTAEPSLRERIEILDADLLTAPWPPRFGLVVVAAAMLPTFLVAGGDAWLRLLAGAIAPAGALCFDAEPQLPGPYGVQRISAHTVDHPAGTVHVTQGLVVTADPPGHVLNVYAEQPRPDGTLRAQLAGEAIRALGDDVEARLARVGLPVAERREWGGGASGPPTIACVCVRDMA
ncbi:MAG TPA: class I SAM-dependent methyltransferase [Baekduia sp.]|nr:class I SAM-dependent methyltransferase [Baekduia sp.]